LIRSFAPAVDVRRATAANELIHMEAAGARGTGTHVAAGYYASGVSRLHGAGSTANLQEAMPPTRTHLFKVRTVGGFFLPSRIADDVQHTQG
jgi:hypothetical protein